MSTNQNNFSNAISNINMNSFRAFKILMNEGKLNSIINFNKTSKYYAEKNNNLSQNNPNTKNATKHVFQSQSKRFEWQTNSTINSYSGVNLVLNNENSEISNYKSNNEISGWEGMLNIRDDTNKRSIYSVG